MNIYRQQKRYVFAPPKYSRWLAPLLAWISRRFFLRRTFNVNAVHCEGAQRLATLNRQGHSILVAPNHADHADPHVLIRIGRANRMAFHFMAAREGFEKKALDRFMLQRGGAFSVDREGADIAAFKCAVNILKAGRYSLVVFPEGEIYHHHERLDPLNEGVGTMVLRAAAKLPEDKRAYLVPTAMRYTYEDAVAETFCDRLNTLERHITWKPREDMEVVDRIYRLGVGLLAAKEVEYFGQARSGDLVERLADLQHRLVAMIELKHLQKKEETGCIPERVKTMRGMIRNRLTDPDAQLSEEQTKELYDDLDTLYVAVQLYSYPGQYLRENPTIQRIAETILKLEEDVLGEANYVASRSVHVRFDEPIDVKAFLEERALKTKTAIGPLTALMSERIQSMLEEMS